MGGKAIMPDVVTYLAARAGEPVTLPQLASALSIEPSRIQKALSNAISGGIYGHSLDCVHRGQVWVWRGESNGLPVTNNTPAPQPVATAAPTPSAPKRLTKGDMVEVMGLTQDGEAVASDVDGRLYRVVPL